MEITVVSIATTIRVPVLVMSTMVGSSTTPSKVVIISKIVGVVTPLILHSILHFF